MLEVKEVYRYDEEDMREALEIEVFLDGELQQKVDFMDGEHEDNSIGRNFSDVHTIHRLMEIAYEAGKAGHKLKWDYKEKGWFE